jgi:predicted nucleic acid-binding protein
VPGDHRAVAGEIFVDTSAWYPLAVRRDPAHGRLAKALRQRIHEGAAVITTNLIVAETHALLVRRTTRDTALAFVRRVDQAGIVVVRSTAELEGAAVSDWLERYADQEFSLTDALSFAVMTEWAITDALTLDRQFAIAGFRMQP